MSKRVPSSDSELAERIRKGVSADRVELGARIQSLWGGYGELRRAELVAARRAGRSAGASEPRVTQAIVKSVTPPPERELAHSAAKLRSHRRKLRSYRVELGFYRSFAALCDERCRVPELLYGAAEQGRFLFVLEDLDASGFPGRRARCDHREITVCLTWLAEFHAQFVGVAPVQLWPVGTYWHLATRPDELAALGAASLRRAAPSIDARLNAARFKTLVHGDAKLENFCFSKDGSDVAAVDFQYVGAGVGVKDVAYFLSSCLSPSECESQVPRYLDVYFEALRAAVGSRGRAATLDPSELEREWRELFSWAWVDFFRFLLGWAPSYAAEDGYGLRLTQEILGRIAG